MSYSSVADSRPTLSEEAHRRTCRSCGRDRLRLIRVAVNYDDRTIKALFKCDGCQQVLTKCASRPA